MAETGITEQHLAGLLQAARDFAFEQMARDGVLIPFAARVEPSGEINFARFAEPGTSEPLSEICERTMTILASEAAGGAIIAGAAVSAVELSGGDPGFVHGLRIHIEAPGLCREVLVPYALGRQPGRSGEPGLRLGPMVPREARAVIFPG